MKKIQKPLEELVEFLSQQHGDGLCQKAIADRLGVTPQAVSAMLRRGDLKLSKAEQIVSTYGFHLVIAWPGNQPEDRAICNFARFHKYIVSTGMSVSAIALYSGISSGVLYHSLRKGDVSLGTMYAIAEYFKVELTWRYL